MPWLLNSTEGGPNIIVSCMLRRCMVIMVQARVKAGGPRSIWFTCRYWLVASDDLGFEVELRCCSGACTSYSRYVVFRPYNGQRLDDSIVFPVLSMRPAPLSNPGPKKKHEQERETEKRRRRRRRRWRRGKRRRIERKRNTLLQPVSQASPGPNIVAWKVQATDSVVHASPGLTSLVDLARPYNSFNPIPGADPIREVSPS